MQIIAGQLGSRRLRTVEGEGYRPAMGRVREALFSILSHRLHWQGLRVLDLFAGSGSLAFEALSRGAAQAWLVELSARAARCISDNIRSLGLEERAFLLQGDVLRVLRRVKGADRGMAGPFDLVFVDPPYRKRLTQSSLDALTDCGWLADEAWVAVEVEDGLSLKLPPPLEIVTQRDFGQTHTLIARCVRPADA